MQIKDTTKRFIEAYHELSKRDVIKTQTDFSVKIGSNQSSISAVFSGKINASDTMLQGMCATYSINREWLFSGNGEMFKSNAANWIAGVPLAPLVSQEAAAGFGSENFSIEVKDIQAQYLVPDFHGIDFMIRVKGNSMYPKYSSGDVVACRVLKDSKFIEWNKPHLIATTEHGLIVKRLRKGDDKDSLKAVSDNKDYEPFDIPVNEIDGIAIIVGVIRLE